MPNKTIGLQIYAKNKNAELIWEVIEVIAGIVKADEFTLVDKKPTDDNLAYWVIKAGVEVFIDTSNALDVEKETDRLKDQITDTKEYIALLDKKLLNESFISRAPERLVRAEMEKKEQAKQKLEKLEEKLTKLS
jgi:valyl-tRNA synthetase